MFIDFYSLTEAIESSEAFVETLNGTLGPFTYSVRKKTSPLDDINMRAKRSFSGYIEHKGLKIRAAGKVVETVEYRRCLEHEEPMLDCRVLQKIVFDDPDNGEDSWNEIEHLSTGRNKYLKMKTQKISYGHYTPIGKGPTHKIEIVSWPLNSNYKTVPKSLDPFGVMLKDADAEIIKNMGEVNADYYELNFRGPYRFSCKGHVLQQGTPFTVVNKKKFTGENSHADYLLASFLEELSGNFSIAINTTCFAPTWMEVFLDSIKSEVVATKMESCPRWSVQHKISTYPSADIFTFKASIQENCNLTNPNKSNTSISIQTHSNIFPDINTKFDQVFVHDELYSRFESLSLINTFYSVFMDSEWDEKKFAKTVTVLQNLIPLDLQSILSSTQSSSGSSHKTDEKKQGRDKNSVLAELKINDDPDDNYVDATLRLARNTLVKFSALEETTGDTETEESAVKTQAPKQNLNNTIKHMEL